MTISDVCKEQIMNLIAKGASSRRGTMHMSQNELAFLMEHTRNCIQQIECVEHLLDFETFFLLDEGLNLSDEESVALYLEIRAYVRADRKKAREEAGTQHIADWLWKGKPKEDFIRIHV